MATTAIWAEPTIMNVLMAMTAAAHFGGIPRIGSGLMAAIASQIAMRTQQGVAGLLFVIELPQIPRVRCMTVLTLTTQSAVVMIIRLMTANAVGGGTNKLSFHMTAFTSHDLMHSNQRKLRKIMVKPEDGRPSFGDMAGCTYLHFRLFVNIISSMAGCAIPGQWIREGASMAAYAGLPRVCAGERKAGPPGMVKLYLCPGLIPMAGLALLAITALMHIVVRMAAVAIGRRVFLHSAACMAGTTGNFRVFVGQRKAGCTVVEYRRFPTIHTMAGIALRAVFAGMHIYRLVAINAGHIAEVIHLPGMTAATGDLLMQTL